MSLINATSDAHDDAAQTARIAQAVQRLADGRLVAFPTETVYGLGGDALTPQAITRIYTAKGRPANHPVIVHVAHGADLAFWVTHAPPEAVRLIDAFWPGPLTLILPRAARVPDAVTGGQDTVGLRCPAHPVAQALLSAFAARRPGGHGGVAAPSANRFGRVSPTRADHVLGEFRHLAPEDLLVLEGGAAHIGIESTILDVSRLNRGGAPVLLRPGHVLAEDIAHVLGRDVHQPGHATPARMQDTPRVSGSLKAHYAPRTRLEIASEDVLRTLAPNPADAPVALLVLQRIENLPLGYVQHLAPADPERYAHNLYATLRDLDQGKYGCIVLQAPPNQPRWQAIHDRIGRAAAAFSG